ncbi:MAG: CDP-glucose 4,6-dehydratase [Gammaproteobacteria bacterium]|nr:CDP-glucose 4,6-dehydratase [Gammaproteobacteria bacterium]
MKNFKNKTALVLGHTGFKGSWLSTWLSSLGANVIGLSKDVPTNPSNFESSEIDTFVEDNRADIKDLSAVKRIMDKCQPDFIFHLAAQPLVRLSYELPIETIATNALGTANVLEALRSLQKDAVAIIITSDKAYDNVEWKWGYREIDRLGGKDPYSASKGMAELVTRSYMESFFRSTNSNIRLGIARAGNVIGGGDWAMDRIVPDCMQAWSKGRTVEIRKPNATRPWQHVLEPLSGYLLLASNLSQKNHLNGEAYNFGPSDNLNLPVSSLINEMSKYWNNVSWKDVSQSGEDLYEAGLLKLNCDKALADMSWAPSLFFEETVRLTVDWYKQYYENPKSKGGKSMQEFTMNQISEYTKLAEDRGMIWTKI